MARKNTREAAKERQSPRRELITSETAFAAKAPMPAVRTVPVRFVLVDLGAKRVALSGEFNQWSTDKTRMQRNAAGHWEATVELAPGRYEYKFVVDGEWVPDPLAHQTVWNPHGTLNSVVQVSEGPGGTCNCRSYLRPEP